MANHKRSAIAIGTALAAGSALLATSLAGGASASPAPAQDKATSAYPIALAQSARTAMIKSAQESSAATAQELNLGSQEKLLVKDVIKDADGTVHTRYERTFAGMPVLGGDLVVHKAKSGKTKSVTKATEKRIAVSSKALSAAKAPKDARKVVWAASGTPKLAFEKITEGTAKDGTPTRVHVITDAASGKKLFSWNDIHTGTGEGQYSGSVEVGSKKGDNGFVLTDDSRGGHSTFTLENQEGGEGKLASDDDDKWGNGAADDPNTAAVDAAFGAQLTWDYYKTVHGREGIKGDGKGATTRVHYGDNYVNAFWDDSCFCMTYGDGEGNKKPLTSIDVAAHEMTHGVTSATANLEYSGESGGLNEATSDIFAAAVEFGAKNEKDKGDYMVGEMIDINGDGTPLRYMDEPSKDGKSLDYWTAEAGNEDVHHSSGIANHFFYLLSEGSGEKEIDGVKYNSPTKNGEKVEGIGRDKAEKIWFKALTEYMTSTTDYKGAREATVKAATDLYGADGAEVKGVEAAWTGVDVK
ncbi:M4 family metallopeptidase [Streptomyces sp. NA04227]|uniref:M4 family metallopeptidase n=1 Tax=Streptomyces sp. NA04227 TaxID=2742136 RepID=UPI0015908DF3|nr:M4 family metallopeptidase [Streptomyces sp. NA04227]QKW11163.1 M4 family metallopeptidase [Streptomyces sp. NA04227]